MEILDQHDQRSFGGEFPEQLDPGLFEALASGQRMEIFGDVEAEREGENLPVAQPANKAFRRVALENRKLLLEHLAERPVGDAVPVGQTAACSAQRLRRLGAEPLPELTRKPRLADAGVANDREELRLLRDRQRADRRPGAARARPPARRMCAGGRPPLAGA